IMVIAGGLYFLMPSHGDGKITKANFRTLKQGMTQAEVEAILGPGAGRSEYSEIRGVASGFIVTDAGGWQSLYWDGDEGTIHMLFVQGRVRTMDWYPEPSRWDRTKFHIKKWLKSIGL